MKKLRPFQVIVVLVGVVAFGWLFARLPAREPVYAGRPLSYWLQGIAPSVRSKDAPDPTASRVAINAMGTNAIPYLLRDLRAGDSTPLNPLITLLKRQHVYQFAFRTPTELHLDAWAGFETLGRTAKSAVPELMEMFNHHPNKDCQPIILSIFADMGTAAGQAMPLILHSSTNENAGIRNNALYALGQIRLEPALAVPVLIKGLEDPLDNSRAVSAEGLRNFATSGGEVKAAVPALLKVLERERSRPKPTAPLKQHFNCVLGSGNPMATGFSCDVLGPVTEALKAIDPKAAAEAGLK